MSIELTQYVATIGKRNGEKVYILNWRFSFRNISRKKINLSYKFDFANCFWFVLGSSDFFSFWPCFNLNGFFEYLPGLTLTDFIIPLQTVSLINWGIQELQVCPFKSPGCAQVAQVQHEHLLQKGPSEIPSIWRRTNLKMLLRMGAKNLYVELLFTWFRPKNCQCFVVVGCSDMWFVTMR